MRLKAGDRAEGFKSHRGRSEKIWKNPLTNFYKYNTIKVQKKWLDSSIDRTTAEQEGNVGSSPTPTTTKEKVKEIKK